MWDKINVYQYQQFAEALKETDPIEQNVKLIAILNNWTINQVDQLSVERYIAEKEKLNLRVDYGYSDYYNKGFYFTIGECF